MAATRSKSRAARSATDLLANDGGLKALQRGQALLRKPRKATALTPSVKRLLRRQLDSRLCPEKKVDKYCGLIRAVVSPHFASIATLQRQRKPSTTKAAQRMDTPRRLIDERSSCR